MSYTTSPEARVRVIHALCEGASVNGAARQTGVSKPTILKLLVQVGTGAARLHNRIVRGLSSVYVQADEIWSYVAKKERRVTEADPPGVGEAYTFVAIDVDTRLVLSYLVGRRDSESTAQFINDMRARLTVMPQIVTDGFAPYVEAVLSNFGASVNYAMVNKHFRSKPRPDDEVRYEPPRGVWLTKQVISGAPDMGKCTTVHIESQNRTIRTHVRRLTRLSNGFSKKRENHCAALALHFLYYNFVKVHSEIKTTPAVAAKLTDRPWTAAELVAACLVEPEASKPVAVPLALPEGYSGAARELPGGRGWLRVVRPGEAITEGAPGLVRAPGAATTPEPAPTLRSMPLQLSLFPDE
jgi:IS1 family transposase